MTDYLALMKEQRYRAAMMRNVQRRDSNGETALFETFDRKKIFHLLSLGVDINATDNFGNTFIHHICQLCSLDSLYILDIPNINVNVANDYGETPIQLLLKHDFYMRCEVIALRSYSKSIAITTEKLVKLLDKLMKHGAVVDPKTFARACHKLSPSVVDKLLEFDPIITDECFEAAKKNIFQPQKVITSLKKAFTITISKD